MDRAAGPERRGLGRGLEVLIGGATGGPDLLQVRVDEIRPNRRQPRQALEPDAIAGLADSVREQGILQPVVVRPHADGGYELIAGERRWRAARAAGVETLPALVREADDRDSLLLALVENVAREQLSPVEEARAYAVLLDEFGLPLGEVARRVGRSKPAVSNRVRLLELPEDVLALVEEGSVSEGHARAVLAVPGDEERRRLAQRIGREGLSVRAAERLARWAGAATKRPRRARAPVHPDLAERARAAASRVVGRPVRVVAGRVELPFADEHDLAELVEALERAAGATGT